MPTLEAWVEEIERHVAAIGAESGFGISAALGPPDSRRLASIGFPGLLPLWAGTYAVVGLLALPGTAPREWPAVIESDGYALTLASDARTALPRFLMQRLLSARPRSAERLAEQWRRGIAAAHGLHHALGGSPETLEAIGAAATDPVLREALTRQGGEGVAFERAHSALARRIDSSDGFRAFADWFDAAVEGKPSFPHESERFGAWRRQALCWAVTLVPMDAPDWASAEQSMLEVIESFAGVDSGVPVIASWAAEPGAASGESMLVEAVANIRAPGQIADPVGRGLVEAMSAESMDYLGYAHAEAVVTLDERGDPKRAWGALHSAAWWAARNAGEVPPAILDGASLLAARHGWDDIAWVVDRARDGAPAGGDA